MFKLICLTCLDFIEIKVFRCRPLWKIIFFSLSFILLVLLCSLLHDNLIFTADAIHAAEDVIESYIIDTIQLSATTDEGGDEQISCIHFYQDLQNVIEEIDLIKKEVTMIMREMKGQLRNLAGVRSSAYLWKFQSRNHSYRRDGWHRQNYSCKRCV